MLRSFIVAALLVSCLPSPGRAHSSRAETTARSKLVAKKRMPRAKPVARQAAGRCRLGVISALGERFAVQKFGLTIFETKETVVSTAGWGLDDLVLARARVATGGDPGVRRIAYPMGAFHPFYHPRSRLFPDPRESLAAIVKSITSEAHCGRYLVVTRFEGRLGGTSFVLDGIGAYSRGLGSLFRHSRLFANIQIHLLDGRTYQEISSPFANLGLRFARSLSVTDDDLTKLDNSSFPEPPAVASSSATLRERTRALVAATLDRDLPGYLRRE